VRPRLVPVPPAWLRLGGRLLGRGAELDRLLGDFALAPTALAALVGWSPPFDVDRGLAETAAWYRAAARAG
jgi:UDP-glucose 4-epimerase